MKGNRKDRSLSTTGTHRGQRKSPIKLLLLEAKMVERPLIYPCPSCGFFVFDEPVGSYDICPICNWEDDHVQLKYPGMRGGANGDSLVEFQIKILKTLPIHVTEHQGYHRDKSWRPLKQEECEKPNSYPKSGEDYFHAAGEDSPVYYWKVNKP